MSTSEKYGTTIFQETARWHFGDRFTVKGDGPIALVCPISRIVTLFTFLMEAHSAAAENHSNWECKDHHDLVELSAPPPKRTFRTPSCFREIQP